MKRILLASLVMLASCGKSGTPDVSIFDAWARATAPGQTSAAAYMTIANRGSADDKLIAVAAPSPAMAMMHQTSTTDGVSSMQAMDDGLVVPAGRTVQLKPLGAHIMVTDLKEALKAGDSLPLTLRFQHSGERQVAVRIVDPTSVDGR